MDCVTNLGKDEINTREFIREERLVKDRAYRGAVWEVVSVKNPYFIKS